MKKINEQNPEKDGSSVSKNVSRRDFLGISLKALGGLAAIELGSCRDPVSAIAQSCRRIWRNDDHRQD